MPETTLDDLAVRVAMLERQVAALNGHPARQPHAQADTPAAEEADLATRVGELEREVAALRRARRTPKPFPHKPTSTFENLVGTGADLWDSDEDLDKFLADLRAQRQRPGG